jgi:hypothetical protein
MNYQRVAKQVLFYSLGLAALSGVLVMALPIAGDVIGRLLGTAICTALASSILIFAIQRLEIPPTKLFGASLGLFACNAYFCTLAAIWIDYFGSAGVISVGVADEFAISAALLSSCGVLISLGLLAIASKKLRLAGLSLSIIWMFFLVMWLLMTWNSGNQPLDTFANNVRTPMLALFPIIALCFIKRHHIYMSIACGFAIMSCISGQIAMFTSQGHIEKNEQFFLFSLCCGGIAAILGITNVIQYRKPKHAIYWAEYGTITIVSVAITVFCIMIWYNSYRIVIPEYVIRLAVGTGILSSTALIGLIVGQLLRSAIFTNYDGTGLEGTCPRCNATLQIPSGKSHCAQCGLRMKLQIETPHCRACGYDITKLSNATSCSECGEPIVKHPRVQ